MNKLYRQGAVGALLDEYERSIADLQQTIKDISDQELITIVDNITTDAGCKSIQTILSHVVSSGYAYAIYIQNLKGNKVNYPDKLLRLTIQEYKNDLNIFFISTVDTFNTIQDNELEQFDTGKKIMTAWGQVYDIEQMTEHAIVHILRHRRQIEKFKMVLRGQK